MQVITRVIRFNSNNVGRFPLEAPHVSRSCPVPYLPRDRLLEVKREHGFRLDADVVTAHELDPAAEGRAARGTDRRTGSAPRNTPHDGAERRSAADHLSRLTAPGVTANDSVAAVYVIGTPVGPCEADQLQADVPAASDPVSALNAHHLHRGARTGGRDHVPIH